MDFFHLRKYLFRRNGFLDLGVLLQIRSAELASNAVVNRLKFLVFFRPRSLLIVFSCGHKCAPCSCITLIITLTDHKGNRLFGPRESGIERLSDFAAPAESFYNDEEFADIVSRRFPEFLRVLIMPRLSFFVIVLLMVSGFVVSAVAPPESALGQPPAASTWKGSGKNGA